MKLKLFLFTILIITGLTACDNKLDETVYSNLTDETAFTTGENAQAAVNSMYSPLHLIYRSPMFYINDMTADDCYNNGNVFELLNLRNAILKGADACRSPLHARLRLL